jgi:hypothetical protein
MKKLIALPLLFMAVAAAARTPAAPESTAASQQFDCDALAINQRLDGATLRDLGPAHSLDAAAAVLQHHNVKFQRTHGVMTVSGVTPKLLHDINNLPQGEPIVLPSGEGSAICVLRPSADSI